VFVDIASGLLLVAFVECLLPHVKFLFFIHLILGVELLSDVDVGRVTVEAVVVGDRVEQPLHGLRVESFLVFHMVVFLNTLEPVLKSLVVHAFIWILHLEFLVAHVGPESVVFGQLVVLDFLVFLLPLDGVLLKLFVSVE